MKQISIFLFLTLALTSFAAEKSSPTLKEVMQGLGNSMDLLNKGIFNENFKLIEKAANDLADHPKPKSQLPIVIKVLNTRMPKFKSIDSRVHDSAMYIVDLAKKKDMDGILGKHRIIMKSCVACHTQFRKEVSKALSK